MCVCAGRIYRLLVVRNVHSLKGTGNLAFIAIHWRDLLFTDIFYKNPFLRITSLILGYFIAKRAKKLWLDNLEQMKESEERSILSTYFQMR